MLDPNLLDRLLENEDTGNREAQDRLLAYEEQARRFEKYRREAAEWLIATGVAVDDPGWRAAEAPVTRRKRARSFAEMTFTDEQLAIAKCSLTDPVFSRYDGF